MDIVAGGAAHLTGLPHVLTEGSSAGVYAPGWKNALRAQIGRRAAGIIANSEGGASYWAQLAPAPPRWVIPNGLPLEEIAAATAISRAELRVREDQPLILYVGRLHPDKNTETVGRAIFSVLCAMDAVAIFCGLGPVGERWKIWQKRRE
jgi:glycosyltransferase involved in cell wall biosynthesis